MFQVTPSITPKDGINSILKNLLCAAIVAITATSIGFGQTACARLKSLSLPNTTIRAAVLIPTGPYLPIGLPAAAAQYANVQTPSYCRVLIVLTPTSDSDIEVELWMPVPMSG